MANLVVLDMIVDAVRCALARTAQLRIEVDVTVQDEVEDLVQDLNSTHTTDVDVANYALLFNKTQCYFQQMLRL